MHTCNSLPRGCARQSTLWWLSTTSNWMTSFLARISQRTGMMHTCATTIYVCTNVFMLSTSFGHRFVLLNSFLAPVISYKTGAKMYAKARRYCRTLAHACTHTSQLTLLHAYIHMHHRWIKPKNLQTATLIILPVNVENMHWQLALVYTGPKHIL